MRWLLQQGILSLVALADCITASVWIGEEYWTTVHYDGSIETSRSLSDLIHFPPAGANPQQQSFVAYWMSTNESSTPDGTYEAFGHAFLRGHLEYPDLCARFIGPEHENREMCGGFRVLSLKKDSDEKNPFGFVKSAMAAEQRIVEYLDMQISRISPAEARDEQGQPVFAGQEPFFGGAKIKDRTAYGVHFDGSVVEISYRDKPASYVQMVEILEMKFSPEPSTAALNHVEEWLRQPAAQLKTKSQQLSEDIQKEVTLQATTPEKTTIKTMTTTFATTVDPIVTKEPVTSTTTEQSTPKPTAQPPPTYFPTSAFVNGGGFVWRRTTISVPTITKNGYVDYVLPVHEVDAPALDEWSKRLLLRRKKRLQKARRIKNKFRLNRIT